MRRFISLLLVLVLCVSLTCTVFATASSPGQGGEAPTLPGGATSPPGGSGGDVPDTGDTASMGMWLLVLLLAVLALLAVVLCYRKFMKQ